MFRRLLHITIYVSGWWWLMHQCFRAKSPHAANFPDAANWHPWWWGPNINVYVQKGHHTANLTYAAKMQWIDACSEFSRHTTNWSMHWIGAYNKLAAMVVGSQHQCLPCKRITTQRMWPSRKIFAAYLLHGSICCILAAFSLCGATHVQHDIFWRF